MKQHLEYAEAGDTVVVWRVDRLGRSLVDVLNTVNLLSERGVNVRSISDGIDPTTSSGRILLVLDLTAVVVLGALLCDPQRRRDRLPGRASLARLLHGVPASPDVEIDGDCIRGKRFDCIHLGKPVERGLHSLRIATPLDIPLPHPSRFMRIPGLDVVPNVGREAAHHAVVTETLKRWRPGAAANRHRRRIYSTADGPFGQEWH